MAVDFASAQARLGESLVRVLGNATVQFAGGSVDGHRVRSMQDPALGVVLVQARRVTVRLQLADVQALGHAVDEGTACTLDAASFTVAMRTDDADHGWCDLELEKAA